MRPLHYFPYSVRYNPAEQYTRSFTPWQFNQAPMNIPPNVPPMNVPPGAGIAEAAGAAGAGAAAAGAAAGAAGRGFQLDQLVNGANSLYNTAQKFMPIVQQAKPMFNNLPALWKLYKGFKGLPDQDDSKSKRKKDKYESTSDYYDSSSEKYIKNYKKSEPLVMKPSVPKIYQPTLQNFSNNK
jgi:hypothetical protein